MAFRRDEFVKQVTGQAVPGAQVWVCNQPANVSSAPPSPLANISSDVNGLVPITQPIITDGFGHAFFYTAVGLYTIVVAIGGVIQQVYPDQLIGQSGAGSINLETNSILNPSQATLNIVGGVFITAVADGFGGVTIDTVTPLPVVIDLQTNSVNNSSQSKLNLTSGSGITITAGAGGLVTIAASGGAPASALPFIGYDRTGSSFAISFGSTIWPNVHNSLGLIPFVISAPTKQTNLLFDVINRNTSGPADTADVGIYDISGNLVANVGPQEFAAVGQYDLPFVQGQVTFPAGIYFWACTSVFGSTVTFSASQDIGEGLQGSTVTVASTPGTLPATMAPSAIAYEAGGGSPPNRPCFMMHN